MFNIEKVYLSYLIGFFGIQEKTGKSFSQNQKKPNMEQFKQQCIRYVKNNPASF
jgi:hypothetical protein